MHNPENSTINTPTKAFLVIRKPQHSTEAPGPAAAEERTTDADITVTTHKKARNRENDTAATADEPAQRVREQLETSHDQSARDVYNEAQKSLSKRTIVLGPEALAQCIAHVRSTNQGKLLDAMGREHDILLLGIREYFYQ